ncbi:MAG: flavodoxin domain-containing protein [Promethearchaeota archaeon]
MENKTLIAYKTKNGVTRENAQIIGDVLKTNHGLDVDIINLKNNSNIDISEYHNVLVGYGVMAQRAYGKSMKFLKNNDFSNKNLAVFFSSLEAGGVKSHDEAIEKYVKKKILNKFHLDLIAYEGFGGRGLKQDLTNPDKVREWADQLGIKLKNS